MGNILWGGGGGCVLELVHPTKGNVNAAVIHESHHGNTDNIKLSWQAVATWTPVYLSMAGKTHNKAKSPITVIYCSVILNKKYLTL